MGSAGQGEDVVVLAGVAAAANRNICGVRPPCEHTAV
jgi:hypothetical protein